MKHFMKQSLLNIESRGKPVAEKVDASLVHAPSNSITIACPRQDANSGVQDDDLGLMAKWRKTLFNLVFYGQRTHSFRDKQAD